MGIFFLIAPSVSSFSCLFAWPCVPHYYPPVFYFFHSCPCHWSFRSLLLSIQNVCKSLLPFVFSVYLSASLCVSVSLCLSICLAAENTHFLRKRKCSWTPVWLSCFDFVELDAYLQVWSNSIQTIQTGGQLNNDTSPSKVSECCLLSLNFSLADSIPFPRIVLSFWLARKNSVINKHSDSLQIILHDVLTNTLQISLSLFLYPKWGIFV